MNSNEIESNVNRIFENFSKEEFPFDLLLAYGISKTSITPVKKRRLQPVENKGRNIIQEKDFL